MAIDGGQRIGRLDSVVATAVFDADTDTDAGDVAKLARGFFCLSRSVGGAGACVRADAKGQMYQRTNVAKLYLDH